jgi:hexokinase
MKHLAARTKFDIIIDESSNKPGEQSFEKMIAGLYLGEVFRLVLTELIESGHMFLGQNTYKLEKAYAVDTAFLSLMERWVRRQEHALGISVSDFFGILVATPPTSS